MHASETTILPSMRPIAMRIARPKVSRPGPGAKTEWNVPTVTAPCGAARTAHIVNAGLYGECDVHDVDRRLAEQLGQPAAHNGPTVCSVCEALPYMPQRLADAHDLERRVLLRPVVVVDHRRRPREVAGDDRHVVPARRQVRRLPVDVLRDPTELRVVVIGDDRDPHDRGMVLGVPDWHFRPASANRPGSGILPPCRSTSTAARTATRSSLPEHHATRRSRRARSAAHRCRRSSTAPALHFKGSGFYTTDYGKGKAARQESASSNGGSARVPRRPRRRPPRRATRRRPARARRRSPRARRATSAGDHARSPLRLSLLRVPHARRGSHRHLRHLPGLPLGGRRRPAARPRLRGRRERGQPRPGPGHLPRARRQRRALRRQRPASAPRRATLDAAHAAKRAAIPSSSHSRPSSKRRRRGGMPPSAV